MERQKKPNIDIDVERLTEMEVNEFMLFKKLRGPQKHLKPMSKENWWSTSGG